MISVFPHKSWMPAHVLWQWYNCPVYKNLKMSSMSSNILLVSIQNSWVYFNLLWNFEKLFVDLKHVSSKTSPIWNKYKKKFHEAIKWEQVFLLCMAVNAAPCSSQTTVLWVCWKGQRCGDWNLTGTCKFLFHSFSGISCNPARLPTTQISYFF